MSLLDAILNAQGGSAADQLGTQLGLGRAETTSALGALVPAIAAGLHKNTQSGSGLTDLLSALSGGQHQQYVNDPASLTQPSAIDDGNAILGHVFGSKEVSRQVAADAASQTGVSADVLKKMLPMVAALVMGTMSNHASNSQGSLLPGASGGGLMDILARTVGGGSDNSAAGGLGGLLGKLLG